MQSLRSRFFAETTDHVHGIFSLRRDSRGQASDRSEVIRLYGVDGTGWIWMTVAGSYEPSLSAGSGRRHLPVLPVTAHLLVHRLAA
jgi:hypothetical protein